MNYSWDEIEHLTEILEAEVEGRPVDRDKARRLAERLSEIFPVIRNSMAQVVTRMGATKTATG